MPYPHSLKVLTGRGGIESITFLISKSLTQNKRSVLDSWIAPTPTEKVEEQRSRERGRGTTMGYAEIDISKLPVTRMAAGEPTISIKENGQITFSTKASEAFADHGNMRVMWDGERRLLAFVSCANLPKGKTGLKIGRPSKGKYCNVSAAGLLKKLEYNYREAGNQSFDAVMGTGKTKNMAAMELPSETPERKPTVRRKRKNGAESQAEAEGAAGMAKNGPASSSQGEEEEEEEFKI